VYCVAKMFQVLNILALLVFQAINNEGSVGYFAAFSVEVQCLFCKFFHEVKKTPIPDIQNSTVCLSGLHRFQVACNVRTHIAEKIEHA